jgi:ATP adenylyltransferase/5',5'''-P-1,P-4-tetraphosphate phosphorylase II
VPAPDASSLQLNKYSVVEEHFLLVTKGTLLADYICTQR